MLDCRRCKLIDLIQQELAERGNCDTMLQEVHQLNNHAAYIRSDLHIGTAECTGNQGPDSTASAAQTEAAELEAHYVQGNCSSSPQASPRDAAPTNSGSHGHAEHYSSFAPSYPSADTAISANATASDSVLAAAMAAYKQEKRQLWKVRIQLQQCAGFEIIRLGHNTNGPWLGRTSARRSHLTCRREKLGPRQAGDSEVMLQGR